MTAPPFCPHCADGKLLGRCPHCGRECRFDWDTRAEARGEVRRYDMVEVEFAGQLESCAMIQQREGRGTYVLATDHLAAINNLQIQLQSERDENFTLSLTCAQLGEERDTLGAQIAELRGIPDDEYGMPVAEFIAMQTATIERLTRELDEARQLLVEVYAQASHDGTITPVLLAAIYPALADGRDG